MKSRVLIVVRGGVVQEVLINHPIDVMVVDWDNIDAGDPLPDSDYPTEIVTPFYSHYKENKWDYRERDLHEHLKALDI